MDASGTNLRIHRLGMGALAAVLCLMIGCVTTGPRFPDEIHTAYQDDDMRRMKTEYLKVYYSEHRRQEAQRVAVRLEACLEDLHELVPHPTDWGLVPVFLPDTEFNNAYVAFGPGNDPHIVVPTSFTANLFGGFGYTPSASAVGCHEMVHYVHLTQIHGFYAGVNDFFGPSINPQTGLDLWFFEGLATYYESQLVDGVGRHGSPIWENFFAAGIADGRLDESRFSEWDREVPFGGHYLVGSQFVSYLVEEYGEEPLWQLVHQQGSSVLFPFGVSLRFEAVYEKRIGELIDDFVAEMRSRYPARSRPEDQREHMWAGRSAMLEVGPGGKLALFSEDVDSVARIEVFDADGERIAGERIPDVWPGRTLRAVRHIEAMRFDARGEALYFLAYQQGRSQAETSLMRLDIEAGSVQTVREDVQGVGGDLSADQRSFIVASADGHRTRFHRLDLEDETGDSDEELFSLPAGAYVGWVRTGPDGETLALTLMEDDRWSVVVVDADDGDIVGQWSTGTSHRPAFDPHWIDDQRLLFVAATDDDTIQILEADLEDGSTVRRSDAPYMAYNARPDGAGGIWFLNRRDWGWSVDHIDNPGADNAQAVRFEAAEATADGYQAPERDLQIIDDASYSSTDGLFTPRLRVPMAGFVGDSEGIDDYWLSLGLSGRDELGVHNWAVDGQWSFGQERLSGSAAYVYTGLAPWRMNVQLANRWTTMLGPLSQTTPDPVNPVQRDRLARLEISRQWYGMPVWVEMRAADFYREATEEEDEDTRRLLGPEVGAEYSAGRSTSYGGTQSLVSLSKRAAVYPTELGSDFAMGDLRSRLELRSPLPVSSRHRLRLSARGRMLPGVPDDEQLLRIGGFSRLEPLAVSGDAEAERLGSGLLPAGFLFVEPLRGYEDFGLAANRAAIADVDYRYPIVVDRGAATSLTVFPSVFLRGFHLEGFAAGATTDDGDVHAAVGASADMSVVLWRVPIQMRYQIAQRIVDDEQLVHILGTVIGGEF